jgi:hypothetical protein
MACAFDDAGFLWYRLKRPGTPARKGISGGNARGDVAPQCEAFREAGQHHFFAGVRLENLHDTAYAGNFSLKLPAAVVRATADRAAGTAIFFAARSMPL